MHRHFISIVIAVFLSACASNSENSTIRDLKVVRHVDIHDQSESVTAESDGRQYEAKVRLRQFLRSNIQDHLHWFGVDGDLPEYVVDRFTVERDGQAWAIPSRVYSDFGDIAYEPQQWKVRLSSGGNQFIIEYHGSDGAGSYEARLYFIDQTFDHAIISGGARIVERR